MFRSKSKHARQEIEALLHELQLNLENNYKDLAIDARRRADSRLEELNMAGELNGRDYARLKMALEDYSRRMEGYHH